MSDRPKDMRKLCITDADDRLEGFLKREISTAVKCDRPKSHTNLAFILFRTPG